MGSAQASESMFHAAGVLASEGVNSSCRQGSILHVARQPEAIELLNNSFYYGPFFYYGAVFQALSIMAALRPAPCLGFPV